MYEVFTVGGGEYLVNMFNAVAAWAGGGGFRSMLQVIMVMGLTYALIVMAFNMDWRALWNWFIQATLVFMLLLVPTTTVRVVDRINPSLAPAAVGNVPIGLAFLASFTSRAGDWMTRQAETVFVMPNSLQFNTNGMIYGARLMEQAQTVQITNPVYRANLDEYMKQCVFYDVLLGFKSMETMMDSTDLWASIGPGSPARSQKFLYPTGSGASAGTNAMIITCNTAYTELTNYFNNIAENSLERQASRMYPGMTPALAAQRLKTDLPMAAQYFHGNNLGNALQYLRQNTMIDAFRSARESFSAAGWDAFASQRADVQARNSYTSIAQQAMTWVPLLHNVLTVVFYAMFIVIFPLFMIPKTGLTTLRGYASGFFYLASWGPLYVLLHSFVMARAANSMGSLAPHGSSLALVDGIQAVNDDIATVAGFLMMSVPFLAAGMARGAMAIAGQATTMLAPAQSAAEAAATERTTGNYSYGNVSSDNRTTNMRQANQWNTAPTYTHGEAMSSYRNASGVMENSFADGSLAYDARGAMSHLPVRIDTRAAVSSALSGIIESSSSQRASMSAGTGASFSSSDSSFQGSTRTASQSSGERGESGWRQGLNTETTESSGNSTAVTQSAGTGHTNTNSTHASSGDRAQLGQSSSRSVNSTIGANGNVGAGTSRMGAGLSGSLSTSASVAENSNEERYGDTGQSRTRSASSSASENRSTTDSTNTSSSDTSSSGTYNQGSQYNSSDVTNAQSSGSEHRDVRSNEEHLRSERSADRVNRASEMLSRVQSNDLSVVGDITTTVASIYEERRATNSDSMLPSVYATNLSAAEYAARDKELNSIAAEYVRPMVEQRLNNGDMQAPIDVGNGVPSPEMPNAPALPSRVSMPGEQLPPQAGGGRNTGATTSTRGMSSDGSHYDGSHDARANNMPIAYSRTRIGNLHPSMAPVINTVAAAARDLGIDPRAVTSGTDGVHTAGSQHYDRKGLDFRGKDIPIATGRALANEVRSRLGSDYYVAFETFPDDPSNNHLHVSRRRGR